MSAPIMTMCGAAILALALPVAIAGSALEVRERCAAAADSAALAAADALNGWIDEDPCALARRVVAEFRVALTECVLDRLGGEARVMTSAETVFGSVHTAARAAPPGE